MTNLVEKADCAFVDADEDFHVRHGTLRVGVERRIKLVEAVTAVVLKAAAKVAILDERDVPKAAKHDVIKMRWYQWGKDDASQEIYDAILALGDNVMLVSYSHWGMFESEEPFAHTSPDYYQRRNAEIVCLRQDYGMTCRGIADRLVVDGWPRITPVRVNQILHNRR